MAKSAEKIIKKDVNDLLAEAQQLFNTAASLTGDKAEQLRADATELINRAVTNLHAIQESSLAAGKEAMSSADNFVRENPWPTISAVAGIGLLAGFILGRK